LARGDHAAALAALARVREPWPAPLAAELLLLRARAEFGAGWTLEGIRSLEERASVVGAADARTENYRLLVDALLASPAAATVPAGGTDRERGWLELREVLAPGAADAATMARRAADWRQRHPHHPGAEFLPQAVASGATADRPVGLPIAAPDVVAVLLPLSGRNRAVGVAVRDGFLAASLADPAGAPRVRIHDTAGPGIGPAYRAALADGAQFVVGPLLKEEIEALVTAEPLPVPTLALNAYPGASHPAFLFQFSLDPEEEARAVARRIAADGHVRGIALFPRSSWGERLHAAFTAELQATGVTLTSAQFYDPGARDFSGPLRAALGRFGGAADRRDGKPAPRRDSVAEARDGPQFAFVAATSATARALKPQMRFQMAYDLPVYATSDAWDPSTRASTDVEGMVFPEMPWVLYGGQGAPELWDVLHDDWASAGRGRLRLYAFGYDAFRLMRNLRGAPHSIGLNGLTGQLQVAPDGRVQRQPEWARIEGGRPQPAGAGVPLPPAGVP
ncbi:MAG: penicillin-binding protein activator, partial [Steroidobacteraceae bacterium]